MELERYRLGANGQDAVKNLRISMIGEEGGSRWLSSLCFRPDGLGAATEEMLLPHFSRCCEEKEWSSLLLGPRQLTEIARVCVFLFG